MGGLVKRLAPVTSSKELNERFDVADRIRTRVDSEKARLESSRISIQLTTKQEDIFLYSDPVKFDQIISNLLINAMDALMSHFHAEERKIVIEIAKKESKVIIRFSDNGPGVPRESHSKIFDPFYTTKPTGQGEGLGLFIVWNILKIQGGNIRLDDTYKEGAKFIITISNAKEAEVKYGGKQ